MRSSHNFFTPQLLILFFKFYLFAFNRRFNLIDPKETEVLRDLEIALHLTDDNVPPTGGAASDSVSMASATSTLTNTTAGSTITSSSGIGGTDTSMSDSSMSHTQIDGDALAQPICKQPLESGNDPVSLISSHHNNSSNYEQQQPMSCSGDATTTFMSTNSDSNSDKGGGGQDTINAHLQSAA